MAQPTLWPKKTFFYPVGNTLPCCFTQDLAPEKDANLLLLACGDPRSILYTTYAQLGFTNRKLDFTCCDWEPAVLARNVLLFTMIIDGINPSVIWEIFYHFFFDRHTSDILVSQCHNLVKASSNMGAWKASKYGRMLRMCTEQTLVEIRRHWTLYSEMAEFPNKEKEIFKQSFLRGMQSVRSMKQVKNVDITPATGPLIYAYISGRHFKGIKSHAEFWTNGVTSSELFSRANRNVLNPTFVYSKMGKMFNVHYGTDPVKAFFLAPSLASLKDGKTKLGLVDVVKLCIEQFSSWCESFGKRVVDGNTVIRIFVGDAVACCRSLGYFNATNSTKSGAYTYPWGGSMITLDAEDYSKDMPTPTQFDVIDTSNLTDHCGLLNLLVVTIPLLQPLPSSVIHTDTLLATPGKGVKTSGLTAKAFADIPTLSLFLGVAPTSFTSHFSSTSNKHHILANTSRQFSEPITWKWISSVVSGSQTTDRTVQPTLISCDSLALADFLLSVYREMFSEEDQVQNLVNFSLSKFLSQHLVLYQRASFVALLHFLKTRIITNWEQTMQKFLDLVAHDCSFLMGAHSFQDLSCHLHLRGIFTVECLRPRSLHLARSSDDRLCGWKTVPPVVSVVLKVPRKALRALEGMDSNEIGTPMLQCETSSSSFHNIHAFFQPIFGDIRVSDRHIDIIEDPDGMDGVSPLIVAFHMTSVWLLGNTPVQIGFHIRSTLATVKLLPKFGPRLTIFSTSLTDTENVFIVPHRPGNSDELVSFRTPPAVSNPDRSTVPLKATFDKSRKTVPSLTIRDNITNHVETESLSRGSPVSSRQIADCSILVSYECYKRVFVFPYPINGHQIKTRVARKSSYIEVECPIRRNFDDFRDLSLNPFPMARTQQIWNLLNMHYTRLSVLPTLRLAGGATRLKWASVHLGMSISEAERELQVGTDVDPATKGAFLNLKESIHEIFAIGLGLRSSSRCEAIGLHSADLGVYTLIFINGVRLDLPAHTIIVDAVVVPLTDSLLPKIAPALYALSNRGMTHVQTNDEEMRVWRMVLPVLAERCRTWKHTPNCEYLTRGVPACLELDGTEESPLCSCGKGRDLGAFGENAKWELLHKEAVRIAIGPLFSFSFLEGFQTNANRDTPAAVSKPLIETCANCGELGKPTHRFQVCSACKKVSYCSRTCQTGHWKAHKPQCK